MHLRILIITLLTIVSMESCTSQSIPLDGLPDASFDFDCATGSCSFIDHPPDAILTMPPPPIPLFMKELLSDANNTYSFDDGRCNFCEQLAEPKTDDERLGSLQPTDEPADSMTSVIIASIIGLSFGSLLLLMIWCRKGQILPIKDCPIFPQFFSREDESSPSPSPSPYISPVVNEKSPQSTIITDPSRGISSQIKYSRGPNNFASHPQNVGMDSSTDHYTGSSCTSSPVYAELDGPIAGSSTPNSAHLISGQSPYSVGLDTYFHIPETLRIGSSTGFLSEGSYDNAPYPPISNFNSQQSDCLHQTHHYRVRASIDGSLLYSDQMLMHASPHMVYVTTRGNNRSRTNSLAQQLALSSMQRM